MPPPRTHFNSRKDTLTKSAGWKRLLQSNRCVLLAKGFFEWSDTDLLPKGHPKMAGRYSLTGDRLMPLAAIWSPVQVDGREILTVSVVTCEPNAQLAALPHHRMPGILLGNDLRSWMDPKTETPEQSLHATPESEIEVRTVVATKFRELVR